MDLNIGLVIEQIEQIAATILASLPNLILAALLLFLFSFVSRWVARGVEELASRASVSTNATLLLGRLVRWVVLIVGGLIALSVVLPSFEPGQLIELLGIATVAIGFAFRDIFQNFLAGILILLTEPFQVGDQIIVDGYEGTVESIQTRATTIRTYDNRRVVIPNSDLFTDSVTVNTAYPVRRSQYDVGVGYDTDLEAATDTILAALQNIDGLLDDPPPDVRAMELADSSVILRVRWWTRSQRADVVAIHDGVIRAVKKSLDAQGVDIPFPIRTVYLHEESGEEVGG